MTTPILPAFKRGDSFSLTCISKVDGVATALGTRTAGRQPKID